MQVLPEVAAITQLGIDIAVFPETKLARGGRAVEVLRRQLNTQSSSRVIQSAAPRQRISTSDYQPGGVLMAITGRTTDVVSRVFLIHGVDLDGISSEETGERE